MNNGNNRGTMQSDWQSFLNNYGGNGNTSEQPTAAQPVASTVIPTVDQTAAQPVAPTVNPTVTQTAAQPVASTVIPTVTQTAAQRIVPTRSQNTTTQTATTSETTVWRHNELELNSNDVMLTNSSTSSSQTSFPTKTETYSDNNKLGIPAQWNVPKTYDKTLNGSAWGFDAISRGQTPLTDEQLLANTSVPLDNVVYVDSDVVVADVDMMSDVLASTVYANGKYVPGTNSREGTGTYVNYSAEQKHMANNTNFKYVNRNTGKVVADMSVISNGNGGQEIVGSGNIMIREHSRYAPTTTKRYGEFANKEPEVINLEVTLGNNNQVVEFIRDGQKYNVSSGLLTSGEDRFTDNMNTIDETAYGLYLDGQNEVAANCSGVTVNLTTHYADGRTTTKTFEASDLPSSNLTNTASSTETSIPQFNHIIELQKNEKGDPVGLIIDGKKYNGVRSNVGTSGGTDTTRFTTLTDDGTEISYYRDANGDTHIQSVKNGVIVQETVNGKLVNEYRTLPKNETENGEWKTGEMLNDGPLIRNQNNQNYTEIQSTLPEEEKNRILGIDTTKVTSSTSNVEYKNLGKDKNGNDIIEVWNKKTNEVKKVTINEVDTNQVVFGDGTVVDIGKNSKGKIVTSEYNADEIEKNETVASEGFSNKNNGIFKDVKAVRKNDGKVYVTATTANGTVYGYLILVIRMLL